MIHAKTLDISRHNIYETDSQATVTEEKTETEEAEDDITEVISQH